MRQVLLRNKKCNKQWLSIELEIEDLTELNKAIQMTEECIIDVKGIKAEDYNDNALLSVVLSGAQFALRKSGIVFQKGVLLNKLCGNLVAEDMDAIAQVSFLAVSRLLDKNFVIPDEWEEIS